MLDPLVRLCTIESSYLLTRFSNDFWYDLQDSASQISRELMINPKVCLFLGAAKQKPERICKLHSYQSKRTGKTSRSCSIMKYYDLTTTWIDITPTAINYIATTGIMYDIAAGTGAFLFRPILFFSFFFIFHMITSHLSESIHA